MAATHLFVVCQALDARALYVEMRQLSAQVVRDVLRLEFALSDADVDKIARQVIPQLYESLDRTTAMDTAPRMAKVASEAVSPLLEALASLDLSALDLRKVTSFRTTLADKLVALLTELRCAYLGVSLADVRRGRTTSTSTPTPTQTPVFDISPRGRTPASAYLAPRTRVLYEFVREELGIGMHGADNLRGSVIGMRDEVLPGLEVEEAVLGGPVDTTFGDKVAIIVEAIRDGRMARVLVRACAGVEA